VAGWSARRGSGLGAILVGFIPGGDEGKCAPRTLALERMALSSGSPALNGTPCLDVDQNGGRSPACFCVSRPRNCASEVRFFSAARSIAVRWWGFCGAAATDDAAALERPEPLAPGRVLLPFRAPSGEFRPLASLELAAVISALPTNECASARLGEPKRLFLEPSPTASQSIIISVDRIELVND